MFLIHSKRKMPFFMCESIQTHIHISAAWWWNTANSQISLNIYTVFFFSLIYSAVSSGPACVSKGLNQNVWLCNLICFTLPSYVIRAFSFRKFRNKLTRLNCSVASTVEPVLVVTSIKQPTCIKQPEESCPKIHIHISELYLAATCLQQPHF